MGPKIEKPPFIDKNLDLLKKNTYKQTKKRILKNNMNIRQVLMWTATSISNQSMGLVIIEGFLLFLFLTMSFASMIGYRV